MNPDVQLHHMYDPNQDRLMIQRMAYFRVKRLILGAAYERFIEQSLEHGGTIFVADCRLQWPTTRFSERHVFQFGALGGASPDEYHKGGPRVSEYLARYDSHRSQWNPPPVDGYTPEAEWGFEARLNDSIETFAARRGFRVRRIVFAEPEDCSPLVADFYRWWNRRRQVSSDRLLVESFIVMEPYWTVRTGSAPFWMVFNTLPSADALRRYLDATEPFKEIFITLFSHGVDSIGVTPLESWRALLARATERSGFLGVDETVYPRDFAVFVRYHNRIRQKIQERHSFPLPLSLEHLDQFLAETQGAYRVQWS